MVPWRDGSSSGGDGSASGRDGLASGKAYCSWTGPGFSSQTPYGSSYLLLTAMGSCKHVVHINSHKYTHIGVKIMMDK